MSGFTAILLMGGRGIRLGGEEPKQFRLLGSQPTYLYALKTFLETSFFEEILLVCHPDWLDQIAPLPTVRVIPAGHSRQESSFLGLKACRPSTRYVVIHDAVRPFISKAIIQAHIEALVTHKAVDTCISSHDTLVSTTDGQTIHSIPKRSSLLRGQTPQSFAYDLILKAHQQTERKNVSDDCSLVLELPHPVFIVPGEEQNFKITTEWDWLIAEHFVCKHNLILNG